MLIFNAVCIAAVLIVIAVLVYFRYQSRHASVEAQRLKWYVLPDFANAKEAARILDRMNNDIMIFLKHLQHKYRIDYSSADLAKTKPPLDPNRITMDHLRIVSALLDNYNYEKVYENRPKSADSTSYTVSKGESMYICLRDGQDHTKFVDYQVLLFVIIHELSHIANYDKWGHDDRFWTVFRFMLREAIECGIYQPIDYSLRPVDYCKLHINYSPYYDQTLPELYPGPAN